MLSRKLVDRVRSVIFQTRKQGQLHGRDGVRGDEWRARDGQVGLFVDDCGVQGFGLTVLRLVGVSFDRSDVLCS